MQIWLSFRYSSDPVQMWPAPGSSAPPLPPARVAGPLTIGFNTGTFYTGHDYWMVVVQPRNAPAPRSTGWFQCALGHADDPCFAPLRASAAVE